MNEETNKGCGGNCQCACGPDEETDTTCELPKVGVMLDKDGKCPCGKGLQDCCHKDEIKNAVVGKNDENEALHELCEPHNGKHVCDVDSDLTKTAS